MVDRLITDLAVFDFTPEGMVLAELLGEAELDEVRAKTEAAFTLGPLLKERLEACGQEG